jgi:GT2 family glycosyltransferase
VTTAPLISVVIPTWNGRPLLARCLASLEDQRFRNFETIVVDNGSSDDSAAFVRARFRTAVLVRLPRNLGFAAAVNVGARAARGRYLAILNSDTELAVDWLGELVACVERHPCAASVTGKTLRLGDPAVIDGAGDFMTWSLKAYRRGWGERDRGQYEQEEQVFSASGTASLWRTDIFRKLGGFDDSYFAYYEDVDLGFRARLAGFECWYTPQAVALHEGHGTTRTEWREFDSLHSVRNRWATIVKNAPRSWLLRNGHRLLLGELISFGRALATGNVRRVLHAYGESFRSLPAWEAERRTIQGSRQTPLSSFRPIVRRSYPPVSIAIRRMRELA